MRLDHLPLVGVELSRLEQDAIRYADLADVVHRARVAKNLGLLRAPADLESQLPGKQADALDVLACLGVTCIDSLREALDQLELTFAQLTRKGVSLDEGSYVARGDGADGSQ